MFSAPLTLSPDKAEPLPASLISPLRLNMGDVLWIGGQVEAFRHGLAAAMKHPVRGDSRRLRARVFFHMSQMRQVRREAAVFSDRQIKHERAVRFELHRRCVAELRRVAAESGWRLP